MSIKDFKCPKCGGAVEFDSTIQKMKCLFCESIYNVDDLEEKDVLNWDVNDVKQLECGEEDDLRGYICQSCGGEVVAEKTTAASSCPFCGNPVIINEQFKGMLRPDIIIPFKKSKEDAKNAYLEHIKNKKLLPKEFKNDNHIDEIKGVYVPFWVFEADVCGMVDFEATKNNKWRDSSYEYSETSIFKIERKGSVLFSGIPVDGSKKMPDDLMESLEPYQIQEALEFKTAYLAGYLADRYDVDAKHSIERANVRIKNSIEELFKKTINGYDTIKKENSIVKSNNGSSKYALYPVWILNTTYQGKNYTFAMNGQTGKFVGNLPIDKSYYKKIIFFVMLFSSLGFYGLAWILHILNFI